MDVPSTQERREAAVKFPQVEALYFTRPALEQASSQAVARHRATRYAGMAQVIDLGCSIGSDSLALAQQAEVPAATPLPPAAQPLSCVNCDLQGYDMSGRYLTDANLTGSDLRRADLSDATLEGAILVGAYVGFVVASGLF